MLVDVVAGARPNFVKAAAIFEAARQIRNNNLELRFVHTGQHYDFAMSESLLQQLNLPDPAISVNCFGDSSNERLASMVVGYEKAIRAQGKPDQICVLGDVTSTLAGALVAKGNGIWLSHVEAGLRSGDRTMPEELNRLAVDALSDRFYVTSAVAANNLVAEGKPQDSIVLAGNTMIDTLLQNVERLVRPTIAEALDLRSTFVMTLHRPSNVDSLDSLWSLIKAVNEQCYQENCKVIFPVHPRTWRKLINQWNTKEVSQLLLCDPLPYLEYNFLLKNCVGVITDSGGTSEEATWFGTPCVTLRDTTERPETVVFGTNELIGGNVLENLRLAIVKIARNSWKRGLIPDLWDGFAAKRIVSDF